MKLFRYMVIFLIHQQVKIALIKFLTSKRSISLSFIFHYCLMFSMSKCFVNVSNLTGRVNSQPPSVKVLNNISK